MEHLLLYVYDESGSPIAILYQNASDYDEDEFDVFFLERNMFGDIVGIYNKAGYWVGGYIYDAWGNFTISYGDSNTPLESTILEEYNLFRYRGYIYDTDTELYYLQSRYYSPVLGKFINADAAEVIMATPMGLTDKNLFAYCDNNPVMRTDEDGEFWNVLIGGVIGATVGFVSALASEIASDGLDWKEDWGSILTSTAVGAVEGVATALVPGAAVAIGASAGIVESVANGLIKKESAQEIILNSIFAAGMGAVGGAGGSDFIKGDPLINEAVASLGNVSKHGVHPTLKRSARKTVKKALKYIGKSYGSSQLQDVAYMGIGNFGAWYTNSAINYMWGN